MNYQSVSAKFSAKQPSTSSAGQQSAANDSTARVARKAQQSGRQRTRARPGNDRLQVQRAHDTLSEESRHFLTASGKYRVVGLLGVGSYAKVRLLENVQTRTFEAVKIINRERASQEFLSRFLPRELEIIREIVHPNIVRVRDVIENGCRIYIHLEYASNGDLLTYVQRHGALMEPLAFRFFSELHGAVRYLHGSNVCHRDLKCENVLLDAHYHVKLTDFGFSRRCVDTSGKRVLSHTYCGSCAYAAPEVLQATPYNPMMYDVWSLGCVLYIVLCGCMPYDDRDPKAMLRAQVAMTLGFPSSIRLSGEATSLIHAILEPNVLRRAKMDTISNSKWFEQSGFSGPYSDCRGRIDDAHMLSNPKAFVTEKKTEDTASTSNDGFQLVTPEDLRGERGKGAQKPTEPNTGLTKTALVRPALVSPATLSVRAQALRLTMNATATATEKSEKSAESRSPVDRIS